MAGISRFERPMVIAPTVTPYNEKLEVDLEAAAKLFYALREAGTGIFVAGTTGEMPLLDAREKALLAETALNIAGGRVPVLAGVGGPDPGRVLEEARILAQYDIDALVIPPPYYYKVPGYMIESIYLWLAQKLDKEIILYTIPSHTGVHIDVGIIERLAREASNIVGVKATVDSSSYQFALTMSLKEAASEFLVFSGFDHLLLYNLALGGDGGIVAGANIAPLLHKQLLGATVGAGGIDPGLLRDLQSLVGLLGTGNSIQGTIKTVLVDMGLLRTDLVRPPLPGETGESKRRILELWGKASLYKYFPKPPR